MDTAFYVGTEDGLIKFRAEGEAWAQQSGKALKGKKVLCGKNLGGRIVACCYKDGVYLSND